MLVYSLSGLRAGSLAACRWRRSCAGGCIAAPLIHPAIPISAAIMQQPVTVRIRHWHQQSRSFVRTGENGNGTGSREIALAASPGAAGGLVAFRRLGGLVEIGGGAAGSNAFLLVRREGTKPVGQAVCHR